MPYFPTATDINVHRLIDADCQDENFQSNCSIFSAKATSVIDKEGSHKNSHMPLTLPTYTETIHCEGK